METNDFLNKCRSWREHLKHIFSEHKGLLITIGIIGHIVWHFLLFTIGAIFGLEFLTNAH